MTFLRLKTPIETDERFISVVKISKPTSGEVYDIDLSTAQGVLTVISRLSDLPIEAIQLLELEDYKMVCDKVYETLRGYSS